MGCTTAGVTSRAFEAVLYRRRRRGKALGDLRRALAHKADLEYEAAFREAVPVEISGATGRNAARINGVYEPTAERRRDRVVYCKRGDGDSWLSLTAFGWMVQDTEDKEADNDVGALKCSASGVLAKAVSPLAVPLATWEVCVGAGPWERQVTLRVDRA